MIDPNLRVFTGIKLGQGDRAYTVLRFIFKIHG
ncbi:MAG: hypothetical protein HLUCCO16_05860 [Phormidium sp. OSCR]|nr:MAG: hypothetical protein HLUCCO16_05860 [Phormidium sp. OSCR]